MAKKKTTLIEAMEHAHLKRRYYLCERVAMFAKVKAYQREVVVDPELAENLAPHQREYIDELVEVYGFSPQIQIPDYPNQD